MKYLLVNAPGHNSKGDRHQKITLNYITKLAQQTEWAEIDAARTEVYLGLCWGDAQEYRYQWAKPKSGCDRIVAACSEPSAIKI